MENKETFFARLEPYFAPSVMRDIKLAYILAKFGHRAQVRKEVDVNGEPVRYFEHLRRVAIHVVDTAKCIKPEMVIAALLHDSLEDTEDLTPDLLEHTFGTDVVNIIKVLSKVPKEGYLERFMLCNDWRTYMIKACDRLDNLEHLDQANEEFQKKQVTETRTKYYPVFQRMVELAPVGPEKMYAAELLSRVERLSERLAGRLHL